MTRVGDADESFGRTVDEHSNCWFAMFICDSCGYASLGKIQYNASFEYESRRRNGQYMSNNRAKDIVTLANRNFDSLATDIEWIPESVLGKEFEDVPDVISDSASEAFACYSIRAYRAAILMSRSVVEAIAKDKGITTGNLQSKIATLENQRIISPLVKEQADEIRFFGNEMAHGDFAAPVKAEDAKEVLNFLEVLIDAVYQQPAKLLAMQEARAKRKEQTAS